MYYRLNKFVFVRNINNYLQIVDKRDDSELIGDYTSYLFAKHLDYSPLFIDTIVNNVCSEFAGNIDFPVVKKDTIQFLDRLIDFGLVSKSNQVEGFVEKETNYCKEKTQNVLLSKDELENAVKILSLEATEEISLKRLVDQPVLVFLLVKRASTCHKRIPVALTP